MACCCKLRYNKQVKRTIFELDKLEEVNSMGNRNISNKETKKKKKVDVTAPAVSLKSVVAPQPEVIKKVKKTRELKDED